MGVGLILKTSKIPLIQPLC